MVTINPNSIQTETIVDSRYKVVSRLGEGGMGTVFHVVDIELSRDDALKLLTTGLGQDDASNRFVQEAKALSKLQHPNIISVFRFGIWQQQFPYIVMELVDGRGLQSVLEKEKRFDWRRAIDIALQICRAVQHAHDQGMVHRDLKPSNIMLLREPHADFVKILDFGLCKILPGSAIDGQKLTQTGVIVGSIYYMSPEQSTGQTVDSRTDIYSLGCILYEMLTAHKPIDGDSPYSIILKQQNEEPAPFSAYEELKSLPRGLEDVVFKAMSKDINQRYQSMNEIAEDLELIKRGEVPQAVSKSHQTRALKRSPVLMMLAIAGGAALSIATFSAYVFNAEPPPTEAIIFVSSLIKTPSLLDKLEQAANRQIENKRFDEAYNLLIAAERLAHHLDTSFDRKALIQSRLGAVLLQQDNRSEAEAWIVKALQTARAGVARGGDYVRTNLSPSERANLTQTLRTAVSTMEHCPNISESTETPLEGLARSLAASLDYQTQLHVEVLRLRIFERKRDFLQMSRRYNTIGGYFEHNKDINNAIDSFKTAFKYATQAPYSTDAIEQMISSHCGLARCYVHQRSFDKAFHEYEQNEPLIQEFANRAVLKCWEAEAMRHHANLCIACDKLPKARALLEQLRKTIANSNQISEGLRHDTEGSWQLLLKKEALAKHKINAGDLREK